MTLKIDDRFKDWMRQRLKDRSYAERVMRALVENDNCTLLKVHPHAALPEKDSFDPEVMIGLIKGHDDEKDKDFLLAIFGDWDEFKDLSNAYIGVLWGMYDPQSDEDFENLPDIYEAAFIKRDIDKPLLHVRYSIKEERDGKVISDGEYYDGVKINLINTNVDSDLISLITGKKIQDEKKNEQKGE